MALEQTHPVKRLCIISDVYKNFFIAIICRMVNRFQLSLSVNVQFFKTFVMPYFDYCGTLGIYFTISIFPKLCNSFNAIGTTIQEVNSALVRYNTVSFQYRVFTKIAIFIHKIHYKQLPINLFNKISICAHPTKTTNTQSVRPLLRIPHFKLVTRGNRSFQFFATTFINECFIDSSCYQNLFKANVIKNINPLFLNLVLYFVNLILFNCSYVKL